MYSYYNYLDQFVGFFILFAIVAIVIRVIIASSFANIAEEKGHERGKAFWLCFLFGIIGWLYVVALPNNKTDKDIRSIKAALDEINIRNRAQ